MQMDIVRAIAVSPKYANCMYFLRQHVEKIEFYLDIVPNIASNSTAAISRALGGRQDGREIGTELRRCAVDRLEMALPRP